eukprot:2079044-Rhodomonas_salina.1
MHRGFWTFFWYKYYNPNVKIEVFLGAVLVPVGVLAMDSRGMVMTAQYRFVWMIAEVDLLPAQPLT